MMQGGLAIALSLGIGFGRGGPVRVLSLVFFLLATSPLLGAGTLPAAEPPSDGLRVYVAPAPAASDEPHEYYRSWNFFPKFTQWRWRRSWNNSALTDPDEFFQRYDHSLLRYDQGKEIPSRPIREITPYDK
jgi:hypothetical protein